MKKGLTLYELVVILTAIGLFLGGFVYFVNKTMLVGQETALRTDLKSIRQALVLYHALNKRRPEDLRELMQVNMRAESSTDEIIFSKNFLNTIGKDALGYPIDIFGNRYYYNREEGIILSATKGYEQW